jgi:superfamily II DNA or RNA helicase
MSFQSLQLQRHYDSDSTDVLLEFYRPLLSESRRYDRAVGYFSSSTFRSCAVELASFITNGGEIRLVIGCLTQSADVEALRFDKKELEERERLEIRREIELYLIQLEGEDPKAAQTFSKMVQSGVVKVKFAVRERGIYHEKFGIFEDELGIKVAFIGSLNETSAALSHGVNHESISVYQSLEPEIYAAYGRGLESRFANLWEGKANKTRIYELDEHSLELIKRVASNEAGVPRDGMPRTLERLPEKFELRDYQNEAIKKWKENKYRGILAMATGTGKTLTAIGAIKRFREKVKGGLVVITVPYQNLAVQWIDALQDQGLETISVFDSYQAWYEKVKTLFSASLYSEAVDMPCLVCVERTFKDDRFQGLVNILKDAKQKNHLLVVDECHHFNGPEHIGKLPNLFRLRLGLSATPYDQFESRDDDRHLEKYFGPIVYEFSLGRAIEEGFLTKYRFHILVCELDEIETTQYEELTHKIVRIAGGEENLTSETWAKVQPIMLARSRIVGAARNKLLKLKEHLEAEGRKPYSLFYCGDGTLEGDQEKIRQIEAVSELIHRLGWRSSRITAAEPLQTREALLDRLRTNAIDAVVSIKVLDEGIDVPSCQRAYLLASQSSDRQGIQRRGRVLRKSEGKNIAELYDFIVIGGTSNSKALKKLAEKEIRRGYQFARDAMNGVEISSQLGEIQKSLGLEPGDPDDNKKEKN